MNEAKDGQPVPSQDGEISESDLPQTMKPETEIGNPNPEAFTGAEKLSLEIERFSALSSEMIALLASLSQETNKSAGELNAIRSAVDLERKGLEALREAEKSAMALQQQIEDLKRQGENLEKLIADQRHAWDAEKVRRDREEKEYYENRKILREREEEEYKTAWAAEQLRAHRTLEEELSAIRQKDLEAHDAAEKDFLERELILKKKEQEWSQLIQELEQFLSKLATRTRSRVAAPAVLPGEDAVARSGAPVSGLPATGHFHEEADSPETGAKSQSDPNPDEILMWENTWEERDLTLDDKQLLIGPDSTEESKGSPSSQKELHILQGGRGEDPNSEFPEKRDSMPLKFSPRNSNNQKPED